VQCTRTSNTHILRTRISDISPGKDLDQLYTSIANMKTLSICGLYHCHRGYFRGTHCNHLKGWRHFTYITVILPSQTVKQSYMMFTFSTNRSFFYVRLFCLHVYFFTVYAMIVNILQLDDDFTYVLTANQQPINLVLGCHDNCICMSTE